MNIREQTLDQRLLNDYQRDFPLSRTPFTDIAKENNTNLTTVLNALKQLKKAGSITRIGPVFRPNTIGVSTLAAMKVPLYKLEQVAELINQFSEVNHNYEREHDFNLWFVATAPNKQHLERTLRTIEQLTDITVMRLPLVKEYHIDLGFKMSLQDNDDSSIPAKHYSSPQIIKLSTQPKDDIQQQLIAEIQSGLPLTERPYAEIAESLGIKEQDVIRRIDIMLTTGTIRRMGIVVRHRELGYCANAMLVWDIPEDQVSELGTQLSKVDCITLCYQRPRHLPDWPYNLFTMIHGKDKLSVEKRIHQIVEEHALTSIPKSILFSKRRFKQRGACYAFTRPETHFKIANDG
jgi:DNA-binding Lrp family transcriptional regulator